MIASIKMPADLFNPNAIVQTSIYVFEAGTPHNYDCDVVKFIDFRNDGYKRTERLISDVDHPAERYQDLYYIYKMGLNAVSNSKFHPELWNLNEVYCEDTIDSSGKDWNYEQHKKLNTVPKDTEYGSTICSHLAWEIGEISDMLGAELSLLIKPPVKTKEFPVKKYFEIEKTSSYNKEALTEPTSEIYDYVTRTAGNRGICERTGFINERGLNEAGVFSLGLLQMTFFYRERQWYAGQFVRKVKCKLPINKFSGIYLETVLSGLSKKLQSGLVRDVDETFLDSNIVLPVNDAGEPDFQFMEKYVKENRKEAFSKYKEWFSAE